MGVGETGDGATGVLVVTDRVVVGFDCVMVVGAVGLAIRALRWCASVYRGCVVSSYRANPSKLSRDGADRDAQFPRDLLVGVALVLHDRDFPEHRVFLLQQAQQPFRFLLGDHVLVRLNGMRVDHIKRGVQQANLEGPRGIAISITHSSHPITLLCVMSSTLIHEELFQDGRECRTEGFGCGDCRSRAALEAPAEQEQGAVDGVVRGEPCPAEPEPANSGGCQGEASVPLLLGELAERGESIDGGLRDWRGAVVAIGGRCVHDEHVKAPGCLAVTRACSTKPHSTGRKL